MEHILQSGLGVRVFNPCSLTVLVLPVRRHCFATNVISFSQPGQSVVYAMVTSQYPCTFPPLMPPVQRRIRLQSILGEHKLLKSKIGKKTHSTVQLQFKLNAALKIICELLWH